MNIKNKLSNAFLYNDSDTIETIFIELCNKRRFLDKWFDKFLDMYDTTMNKEDQSSPIWKKYYERFSEYELITSDIRHAEYYMNKVQNV
jgi:hypothetical protein